MKEKVYKYQFILVFGPKVEEKDQTKVWDKIEGLLGAGKAEISKKEHMGLKDLVYEVKGFRKGDFWLVDFESGLPFNMKDLNLLLNRENLIIRYLVLTK